MECLLKNKNTGIVLVVAAAVLWSTAGAFVKLIDMEALTLSATRSVFAALVLLPFLRPRKVGWNRYLPVLFVLYALTCGSFLMGLRYTNATNAVALHFTSPLWIYAWSLVRGRKIRRQELLPMLCIVCGIIICIIEPKEGTSRLGNITALFSGITFAAFAICLPQNRSQNNVGVICLSNIFAALFLYGCAIIFTNVNIGAEFAAVNQIGWFAIVALGALQLAVAYCLFAFGVNKIGPQKATVIGLLEMVLNPIWVLIFAGETPSPFGIACWIIILAGLILDTLYNKEIIEQNAVAKT